jgi:hypothetical protein
VSHVESKGERRSMYIFLTGKSEGMNSPGIQCVNGRIILKLVLKLKNVWTRTRFK